MSEEWGGMEEAYGPRLKIFVHTLFCRIYVIIVIRLNICMLLILSLKNISIIMSDKATHSDEPGGLLRNVGSKNKILIQGLKIF